MDNVCMPEREQNERSVGEAPAARCGWIKEKERQASVE